MRCTTTRILLAAALGLAGCQPAANNGESKLSSSEPSRFVTQLDSLDIDPASVVPIQTPINVAMQPMPSVSFTVIDSAPGDSDIKVITKGRAWFERNKDGRIEQHKEMTDATMQSKKRNLEIELQQTGSELSIFEANGKVWMIEPADLHMPETAPAGISKEWYASTREKLSSEYSQTTAVILDCALSNFVLTNGSIKTGTPIFPRTRREYFDQMADCMIAFGRNSRPPTDNADYSFRIDVKNATTESALAEIHDRVRNVYEERWAESLAEYSSNITVKGMVVKNGQEFIYADGRLTIASKGNRATIRKQLLIDPYSGLPYQTLSTSEALGPSNDPEVAKYDGRVMSAVFDLPSRTPTNVTIAEPRKPVTSAGGSGSVVDIYNRSIDAIYEVDTPGGTGTAFAISGRQAITAAHVVEGSKTVTLIATSGARLTANVVRRDTQRDVALLELPGAQFPSALNLSRDFAVTGAQVIVIGCPLGACGSVTTGIVSFSARRLGGVAMVQIDAQINPGNSGGPILNTNGDVIGIVEEQINPDPTFQGLSFGLASPEIAQFLGT